MKLRKIKYTDELIKNQYKSFNKKYKKASSSFIFVGRSFQSFGELMAGGKV